MQRLIDANRLLSEDMKTKYYHLPNGDIAIPIIDIEHAPTVDAVPVVHGKWEWLTSTYDRSPSEDCYQCSVCLHITITHGYIPWEKYCPHCGTKMDLEEKRNGTD